MSKCQPLTYCGPFDESTSKVVPPSDEMYILEGLSSGGIRR